MNSWKQSLPSPDPAWRWQLSADIAVAQAKAGDESGAIATIAELTKANDRDRGFSRVAMQMAENGDAGEARRLLRRVEDPVWRATALATVIKTAVGNGGVR